MLAAADEALKAARAEWYPTVDLNGYYGDAGPTLNNSHGVFAVTGSLNFNIFNGGRIRSDVEQARAALKQRSDELADLGGQIDFQVRTAFLDIQSAADQVAVAQSNLELADSDAATGAGPLHRGRGRHHRGGAGAGVGGHRQRQPDFRLVCPQSREGSAGAGAGPGRAGDQEVDRGEVKWLTRSVEEIKTPAPAKRIVRKPKRRRARLIALIVLLPLLVGGYFLWRYFGTYESTDDAQIDGHINAISARISGHVNEVLVEDEQIVKAGDVLVSIDPRDYEVAVAKAEADLADAEATLESSRTDIPITSTNTASTLKTAQSLACRRRRRAARRAAPVRGRRGASRKPPRRRCTRPRRTTRKPRTTWRATSCWSTRTRFRSRYTIRRCRRLRPPRLRWPPASASVNEARQNITVAEAAVQQAQAKIPQADASIQSAMTAPQQVAVSQARAKSAAAKLAQQKALLDQARLNLSYCTIVAPVGGIVGKKTVEVGQNVSPGQQLMAVVPLDDIWVTANFKETQLQQMKPGQRVRFSVDAYGREYEGRVTGIGGASGSRFSLLPPENATGNYVKVVQRIPVRIDLDPGQNDDHRLRPGMSVDPKVLPASNCVWPK